MRARIAGRRVSMASQLPVVRGQSQGARSGMHGGLGTKEMPVVDSLARYEKVRHVTSLQLRKIGHASVLT